MNNKVEKLKFETKTRKLLDDLYKSKKLTKNKYNKLVYDTYTKNITGIKNMYAQLEEIKDLNKIKLNLKAQARAKRLKIDYTPSDKELVEKYVDKLGGLNKVNLSNQSLTRDDTDIKQGMLTGAFSKLRHYISKLKNNFLYVRFYTLSDNKFINEYNLKSKSKNNTFKGIKEEFSLFWYQTYGSGAFYGNCTFVLRPKIQAKKHNQRFKEAINSNCFMNAIKIAMKEGQRARENIKTENKIKNLNDRFFINGVRYEDISIISRELDINIIVKNRLNDVIYDDENKRSKSKTITITSPHIDHVEFIKNNNINKKDKELIVVNDIQDHYNNNTSSFKYFKKIEDNLIWYYDENSLYYKPYHINDLIVNKDKYFIHDDFSYYENKFIEDNNLSFNVITKNENEYVFKEINDSVHHINEYIFNDNLACHTKIKHEISMLDVGIKENDDDDLSENDEYYKNDDYTTYDNNKCFVGFMNNKTPAHKYYNQYNFPSNKYNAYNIDYDLTIDELNIILQKTAIIKITDIVFNNKVVEKLDYFQDGYNYTTAILKYCIDHNIMTFKISQIIDFNDKQKISFSDDIIKAKHYNKIIGLMSHINNKVSTSFEFKDYDDISDLLYFSSDKINTYNLEKKIITIQQDNENIFNKSHISSFILSYAFINILDVIKDVQYDNLIYVKCDALTVKKPLNLILSLEIGGWKKELTNPVFNKTSANHYVNYKEGNEHENNLFSYSMDKMAYKKYNFISGGAGCGKTTRFLEKFENSSDERVYNSLLLLPTNELLYGLKKKYDIPMMTYQSFLTHNYNTSKYNNILLDEVTMIGSVDFSKIMKMITSYNQNIFIIGDYDIINKKSYQLLPVDKTNFINNISMLNKDYVFYKHLTVNYRQGSDNTFTKFLNSIRGLTNDEIKKNILSNKLFTKVSYNDVVINYKIGDKILSPVHTFINKINDDIKPINDMIQILYTKTTKEHAKNETGIININDFDNDKHKIGYCQTAHTAQGQTYTNDIYININNLFCDNLLYVMLSRAKESKQIKLII